MEKSSAGLTKNCWLRGSLNTITPGLRAVVPVMNALLFCAGASWAATITGNVVDYNAAEVKLANDSLVVPAAVATYTASTTIPTGSNFTVTLPAGFTFGSVPSLTTSGTSTFTLSSGGMGAQSATFTVATANVTASQTISLAGFTVNGATALETVTPVASALPLTMQAIGIDASPLSFGTFASDVGARAVFVGAIQFIDTNPPSNGTEFFGSPDRLTAVLSAIAISAQTVDSATGTVAILSPNGNPNQLSGTDTATVTFTGNFGGFGTVFISTTSDCNSPIGYGTLTEGPFGGISGFSFSKVPINTEEFFCVTASGGPIQTQPNGFTNIAVSPGSSIDFLSAPVNNEFPGLICPNLSFACQATIDQTEEEIFGLFLSFFFR